MIKSQVYHYFLTHSVCLIYFVQSFLLALSIHHHHHHHHFIRSVAVADK